MWLENIDAAFIPKTPSQVNSLLTISFIALGTSIFILFHSFLLHSFKFKKVRILSDTAATSLLATSTLSLAMLYTTPPNQEVAVVFFINGIFSIPIRLANNAIFYLSFIAIANKTPKQHRYLLFAYIFSVLFLTWIPQVSILPFFVSATYTGYQIYNTISLNIFTWGTFLFNAYMVKDFITMIRQLFKEKNNAVSEQAKVIAIKSIIHCCTTNAAVLILKYALQDQLTLVLFVYHIILAAMMHFLFNYRSEFWILKKKKNRTGHHSGRESFSILDERNFFEKMEQRLEQSVRRVSRKVSMKVAEAMNHGPSDPYLRAMEAAQESAKILHGGGEDDVPTADVTDKPQPGSMKRKKSIKDVGKMLIANKRRQSTAGGAAMIAAEE